MSGVSSVEQFNCLFFVIFVLCFALFFFFYFCFFLFRSSNWVYTCWIRNLFHGKTSAGPVCGSMVSSASRCDSAPLVGTSLLLYTIIGTGFLLAAPPKFPAGPIKSRPWRLGLQPGEYEYWPAFCTNYSGSDREGGLRKSLKPFRVFFTERSLRWHYRSTTSRFYKNRHPHRQTEGSLRLA
jgi:hypothetical protein